MRIHRNFKTFTNAYIIRIGWKGPLGDSNRSNTSMVKCLLSYNINEKNKIMNNYLTTV